MISSDVSKEVVKKYEGGECKSAQPNNQEELNKKRKRKKNGNLRCTNYEEWEIHKLNDEKMDMETSISSDETKTYTNVLHNLHNFKNNWKQEEKMHDSLSKRRKKKHHVIESINEDESTSSHTSSLTSLTLHTSVHPYKRSHTSYHLHPTLTSHTSYHPPHNTTLREKDDNESILIKIRNGKIVTPYYNISKDSNKSITKKNIRYKHLLFNDSSTCDDQLMTTSEIHIKKKTRGGRAGRRKNRKRKLQKQKARNKKNICNECNRLMPSRRVLRTLRKQHGDNLQLINFKFLKVCPNCTTTLIQNRRKQFIDNTLLSLMSSSSNTIICEWSNKVECYDIKEFCNVLPFNCQITEDTFFKSTTSIITIRRLHIPPVIEHSKIKEVNDNLKGATLPFGYKFCDNESNTISKPDDVDFGLIIFETNKEYHTKDYLLIGNLQHKLKDVLQFSVNESKVISKLSHGGRSGCAGGVVFPDSNSASLSQCTRNNGVIMQRKKSVGCAVSYETDKKEIKTFHSVYNQIKMNRISQITKRYKIMKCECERTILLSEMKSRFIAILLLIGLDDGALVKRYDLINSMIETLTTQQYLNRFQQFTDSAFQAFLYDWGVSTGAMHNHEAICAHTDGNKSHPLETLTIYPRLPDCGIDGNDNCYLNSNGFVPGYLSFPIYGLNLKINCGKDIVHCSLKNTIHLPDQSRSYDNWSRVQGP